MTSFNFMGASVLEVSHFFDTFHWLILSSMVICLMVIGLNLYVFLSYSRPHLILKKKIIEQYKSNFQNHKLVEKLNKIRKILLKVSMVYNFITVIVLGIFWYVFEKVASVVA